MGANTGPCEFTVVLSVSWDRDGILMTPWLTGAGGHRGLWLPEFLFCLLFLLPPPVPSSGPRALDYEYVLVHGSRGYLQAYCNRDLSGIM